MIIFISLQLYWIYFIKPSFVEDEDVLVESENGSFLWDAVVVDTSKDPSGHVNGYFVHFKGWSSRYDCWVPRGDRVLEANCANLKRQVRLFLEFCLLELHSLNSRALLLFIE